MSEIAYVIPVEIWYHIFSFGDFNSLFGVYRTVCKRFAEIIKPTRILPTSHACGNINSLRYLKQKIKRERLANFAEFITCDFINFLKRRTIYGPYKILDVFRKWILGYKFPEQWKIDIHRDKQLKLYVIVETEDDKKLLLIHHSMFGYRDTSIFELKSSNETLDRDCNGCLHLFQINPYSIFFL